MTLVLPITTKLFKDHVQDHVKINIQPIRPIRLQLKTVTGQLFNVTINPHHTVLDLKKQIYIQQEITFDTQRIIFQGKQLEDPNRLCDYNIGNESVLHLVLRLRGGMFHKSSSRADWISLHHYTQMEKGLTMLDYLKRSSTGKLVSVYQDLEDMLTSTRDDTEIDLVFDLIRTLYIH
jgi:hypothetical protein